MVRTRLLQQALRQGHARHATASVSPLSVVDMEFLLWQCLGQPMRQHWVHGGKVLEYDLRTGGGSNSSYGSRFAARLRTSVEETSTGSRSNKV